MSSLPKRFTDHIALWVRWRWFLFKVVFFAALLTAIISSLMPKTYRSTAIVLPPFEGGTAIPFLQGVTVDIFGSNEVSASTMATLLKSRTLKDRIQKHIDLKEHYKKDLLEKAYAAFEDAIEVELESEESFGAVNVIAFKIHVMDRDPEYCARMVNLLVDEWNNLVVELNIRGAQLRRQFVEENLKKNSEELFAAEDSMRSLQDKYGVANIEAQVEGTVTSSIALEQKIVEARIAVQVMEKLFQPNHPNLQRAKLELQGLLEEQKKLRSADAHQGLMLPLDLAPEISLEFARRYREVLTLETIHQVLVQQYEQARMQETKSMPALRIVDRGVVPEYKYRPKRIILVAVASLCAFFLAVVAMYFFNYADSVRGTSEYQWIEEAQKSLQSDFRRISRIFQRKNRDSQKTP